RRHTSWPRDWSSDVCSSDLLRRRDAFVTTWQATEPAAVATLLRDFEQTIVYVDVQAAAARRGDQWDATYLRTTSALEGLNRTLRSEERRVGKERRCRWARDA